MSWEVSFKFLFKCINPEKKYFIKYFSSFSTFKIFPASVNV